MTDPNTGSPTPNPDDKPISPTGAPLIPPRVLPWLMAVYAALGGLEGALAWKLGVEHPAVFILGLVLVVLAPFLGIASPGLRRAAAVLLVIGVSLNLTACATFKADASRFFKETASCTLGSATAEGKALLDDLDTATKRGAVDWESKGEQLGWDALACALEALANIVQNRLELALAKNEMGALPDREIEALVDQVTIVHQGLERAQRRGEVAP